MLLSLLIQAPPPDCGVSLISEQDPSGEARSLSRAQFIGLAWRALGRGSRQHYGFLFDSVAACQEGGGSLQQEVSISWRSLCSFLLLQLSQQMQKSRKRSRGGWGPPRELSCPHREPVQKVREIQKVKKQPSKLHICRPRCKPAVQGWSWLLGRPGHLQPSAQDMDMDTVPVAGMSPCPCPWVGLKGAWPEESPPVTVSSAPSRCCSSRPQVSI